MTPALTLHEGGANRSDAARKHRRTPSTPQGPPSKLVLVFTQDDLVRVLELELRLATGARTLRRCPSADRNHQELVDLISSAVAGGLPSALREEIRGPLRERVKGWAKTEFTVRVRDSSAAAPGGKPACRVDQPSDAFRDSQKKAQEIWKGTPWDRRESLLFQVLGNDRLIIRELTTRMNAELGYPQQEDKYRGRAVWGSEVGNLVKRLTRDGQLQREPETFNKTHTRYRYFRRFADTLSERAPIAKGGE